MTPSLLCLLPGYAPVLAEGQRRKTCASYTQKTAHTEKRSNSYRLSLSPPTPYAQAAATEMFGLGGHGVTCINRLDGEPVGEGLVGPVFRAVAELLLQDSAHNGASPGTCVGGGGGMQNNARGIVTRK